MALPHLYIIELFEHRVDIKLESKLLNYTQRLVFR